MDPTPSSADIWRRLTDDDAWELAETTVRVVAEHAAGRAGLLPLDAHDQE